MRSLFVSRTHVERRVSDPLPACRFDTDNSGFLDCHELTKLGMSLWLPNTEDGEEEGAKGREEGDELPEAVQRVLALAAENDDGEEADDGSDALEPEQQQQQREQQELEAGLEATGTAAGTTNDAASVAPGGGNVAVAGGSALGEQI